MQTTLKRPPTAAPLPTITAIRIDPAVDVIRRAFAGSGHRALTNIRCRFDGGTATILGAVDSFYLKQLAQEIVRRVPDVKTIRNELRVR